MKPSLFPSAHTQPLTRQTGRRRTPLICCGSIALALLALSPAGRATSDTWTGGADALWANTLNWLGGNIPGTGDIATFNSASANTSLTLGNITLNTLAFDTAAAAAYTIGSAADTLTLNAGGAVTVAATVTASEVIAANVRLGDLAGDQAFSFTNNSVAGGQTLTFLGLIDSATTGTKTLTIGGAGNTIFSSNIDNTAGTIALTKTGAGTLTLSGFNSFAGKTTVSAGTLSFNSIGDVGAGGSALGAPTTVANGTIDLAGTLLYTGAGSSTNRVINLTNAAAGVTINNSGFGALTLTGGITGGSTNIIFRGAGDITQSGVISNSNATGTVTHTDAGTLFLTNAANSFAGHVNIATGTINASSIANSGIASAIGAGTTILMGQNTTLPNATFVFSGVAGGSSNRAISLTRGSAATATTWTISNSVAAQTLTLSGNVALANAAGGTGAMTLAITGAGDGVLSGSITGAPAFGVTKSATGTWTISGTNTYTGTTNITAGIVKIGNASALGKSQVNLTNGATIDLNGNNLGVAFINNGAALSGGIIDNVSAGGNVTLTVGSGVGGVSAINTNYTLIDTFSGLIQNTTGTVGLTKVSPIVANQAAAIMATASYLNGPNVLRLTNQNTYTGATTIKGGILNLVFNQSNNGGAAIASNIISANSPLVMAGGDLITDSQVTGGAGSQTFASLTLNAGASHIGAYRPTSGSATLSLNTITRNTGATIDFMSRPSNTSSNGKLGAADGTINSKTANASFTGGSASILGGYATYNGSTWAVSASNGVTAGNLSGLATFNVGFGATTNVDAAIGTSTPAAMTVNSLRFNTAGAYTVNTAGDLTVATGGILETTTVGANAVAINNNNLTSNNGVDLIVIQNNGNAAGVMTIGSNIINSTGAIGLTKSGIGSLTLTPNIANTFTGDLTINGGTVILGNANALNTATPVALNFGGTSQTIGGTAPSFIFQNGSLNLGGNSASVASLTSSADSSGTAIVQNASGAAATFTVNGSVSTTFAGTIQDGAGGGALSLTKAGSSTLTLLNTAYTGNTTVNGGTLVVKTNINGSPTVTVGSTAMLDVTAVAGGLSVGSTKTLTGNGSVVGGVTIGTGGNLTPGTSSTVGTLTLDTVTLAASSVMNFTLASAGSADFVNVTGSNGLTINGGGFALSGAAVGATGTTFNLFQYVGAIQGTGVGAFSVVSGGIGGLTYTFGNDTVNKFVTLSISGTSAQVSAWGVNANGSWGTAGNWTPAVVPQFAGDTANFGGAILAPRTVTLDGNQTVGAMTFSNANAYTIAQGTSGTLTLNNGAGAVNVDVTSGSHLISAPVTLTSNTAIGVTNAADTLTVSGAVNGGGSLTKAGNGTLVLSTANSYTGGTSISGGTLDAAAGALGTTGPIIFGGGTLRYAAGNTNDLSTRTVTFAGQAVIDTNGNDVTYAAAVGAAGAGGVTKQGLGRLTLAAGNTFTGTSVIKTGTLAISADTGLGAVPGAAVTNLRFDPGAGNSSRLLALGTFILNANRGVSLTSGTGILDTNGNAVTVAGAITGAGVLSKIGAGTLTLSSGTSSYGGGTKVDDGTLTVTSAGSTAALGTGSVTLNNSAILNLGVRALTQVLVVNGTNGLLSGDGGGVSALNTVSGAGTLNVTITGANVDLRGDMTGFTGSIVNAGAGGTFRLNGTAGSSTAVFDLGTVGGISVRNAATAINLGALSGGAATYLGGSSNNATALVYTIGAKNLNTVFAGTIANGGFAGTTTGITKVGTGSLTLSGNNIYTAPTIVSLGTLVSTSDTALGLNTSAIGGLTISPVAATSATVRFRSFFPSIASLAGSGAGTASVVLGDAVGATPTTLTVGENHASTTFNGSIGDETGTNAAAIGNLTKSGNGSLTLTNANTYTGATSVLSGMLQLGLRTSLYNANTGSWTAANISVNTTATLGLNVGGAGQFTTADVSSILALGTAFTGFASGSFAALDTAGGDFVHNAAIADTNVGGNAIGLKKLGANKLTLGGTNTYTGDTTVSAGTLVAASAAALGTTAAGTTVASGAALDVRANIGTEAITVSGTGVGATGALITGAGTGTVGGAVTMTADTSIGGAGALNVTGGITGAFAVTKVGAGTTTLSGAQSYSTLTTSGGTTKVNSSFTGGTATVNANAATYFGASQTLAALNIGAGGVVTFGAPPSSSGFAPAAVPEPGTLGLLLSGMAGILGLRRRRA